MNFRFVCKVCGKCCSLYRIIINIGDALKIFDELTVKFNETFTLVKKSELERISDVPYDFFEISDDFYCLAMISYAEKGCVFIENRKCTIQSIKPSVCYFYPLKYTNENNIDKFSVERYDVCNGIFDGGYSEWPGIIKKLHEYQYNTGWHNEIVKFWNENYGMKKDIRDFIIFFYESLYPIYLKSKSEKSLADKK